MPVAGTSPAGHAPSPESEARPGPRSTASGASRVIRRRLRRQHVPWVLMPALPAVALIAHQAGEGRIVAVSAAGLAILVPCLPAERKRRAQAREAMLARPGRRTRARVIGSWRRAVLAAGAAGWTAQVAVPGWSHLAGIEYAVAWAAVVVTTWNHHRVRRDGTPRSALAVPQPEVPGETLLRLQSRVCSSGGRFPGAVVTELPRISGGLVFRFSLVPGRQSVEDVTSATALRAIASAAQVPLNRVVAEHMPGEVDGENGPEHEARVTILDARHIHREIQEFGGPTLDRSTGLFTVGPYPDGEPACNRLYKVDDQGLPFRACSGLTAGAPGSGKSRYAEHKILEHLASGLFQVFLLDGQGGASIPDLLDYVAWPATVAEEWEICLRAAVRLMVTRTRRQGARRIPCWYATAAEPFVHIQVEEAHKVLLRPVCLRAVKFLIQEGEKAGIGVDLSTQFPSQVELGASSGAAGANVVRDLATSGNVTLFRTGGQFAKNVTVGDLNIAPHRLPRLPGMCYPIGASQRAAPVRAIRAASPADWAHTFPEVTFSDMDREALDGSGDAYSGRHQRLAAQRAEPEAGSLDMRSIEAEVALMLGESTAAAAAQPAAAARVTALSAVLAVLRAHGSLQRSDVIACVRDQGHDYSESAIDQAFATLRRNGAARDGSGRGVWEAVPHRTLASVSSA